MRAVRVHINIISRQCLLHLLIQNIIELTTMATSYQTATYTPAARSAEQPQSIIHQAASPFPYPLQPQPNQFQSYDQNFHLLPNASLNSLQPAPSSLLQTAQFGIAQPVQGVASGAGESRVVIVGEMARGAVGVVGGQAVRVVAGSELGALAPVRRVEYVPYEQRYIEYVEQRIKVPVQRVCTDYYKVEHIVDYMPIEREEVVYETQPQEVVHMRLQYVPVEQKIIHISDKNAQALGIREYATTDAREERKDTVETNPLYQAVTINGPAGGVVAQLDRSSASSARKSRTNFVTSEGYDPQANLQQIDNLLSRSSVRGSRARQ